MYYGRTKELSALKEFYNSKKGNTACIYGRLGIGKTSLLKEFSKDTKHIYFNAYTTTGIRETELFARAAGVSIGKLSGIESSLEQLSVILSYIEDTASLEENPLLIIMDNYPAFAKAEGEFNKLFFEFVKNTENIKVVLIGDSYLAITKLFFDSKSLWKNKLSLCIELKPIGFYEFMEAVPDKDMDYKLAAYGITGGIPVHINELGENIESAVENIFFKNFQSTYLPEKIIQGELRELSYYNHILTILGEGKNRVNQISAAVNKPKDVVVPYMNTLMSIGVVTKENPVTEKTNRKKTRYSIINHHDKFWYKFIVPRMDMYTDNNVAGIMEESVNPELNEFMNQVFTAICKEYIYRAAENGKMPFTIEEIGNWWQNDEEKQTSEDFDLVAVGQTQGEPAIIFGRCYYTDELIDIVTLKELIDLTKQVKDKKNVFYLVFSKAGFHENTTTVAGSIKNIILISLEDVLNG